MVSTRHVNSGDSAADNNGFRCIVRDTSVTPAVFDGNDDENLLDAEKKKKKKTLQFNRAKEGGADIIDLERKFLQKEREALRHEMKLASKKAKEKQKIQKEINKKIKAEGKAKWEEDKEKYKNNQSLNKEQEHTKQTTKVDL